MKPRYIYILDAHLDDSLPWLQSSVTCARCSQSFVLVWRVDTSNLPCPHCSAEGKQRFTRKDIDAAAPLQA